MEDSAGRGRANTRPHASYCWVCRVPHLSSKGTGLVSHLTKEPLLLDH